MGYETLVSKTKANPFTLKRRIFLSRYNIWWNNISRLGDHGSKPWIIFWSMNFFDPNSNFLILDQKIFQDFLIRIKKNKANFWSGSKKIWHIFDPDQKIFMWFLIRIKKISCNFWSGSKNFGAKFDPDQKFYCDIWSGSWLFHDPDHGFFMIRIMDHESFLIQIKKDKVDG